MNDFFPISKMLIQGVYGTNKYEIQEIQFVFFSK